MTKIIFGGFDWNEGNKEKCQKHGVSSKAIESFFENDVFIAPDLKHSDKESRFLAIGESASGRPMFIVFTIRRRQDEILIRPISARYMHDKEAKKYREKRSETEER